ncbi:uncharacterized protein MONOS_13173 [Monocercomonoides exilis]|uniref:uncharacterized protein n=1 Tax=Monocercomonoides exilis TaxID=2049356 RepID=UPI00355A45FE|nr:hypothetical protein MONOS_13173 [Monocercomonoides exilis]|eukprot:MONOS_13173.1-p1 / transcript=MONOS_13173.1 / gene=MONOS_13173 / organism=Monocercomonoides_exilis_PA203 / gene_product=unspecified product / transcript_product=unspecified product / location=Mono_scaffold00785:27062-28374(-) / protein_length=368 / sequence_SO=supercontig / SO=protein_coding / is_pseudo=false
MRIVMVEEFFAIRSVQSRLRIIRAMDMLPKKMKEEKLWLIRFRSVSGSVVSRSGCIGAESGKGESACVFECSFTSYSLTRNYGGGMNCSFIPATLKIRSIQFISCSAASHGGESGNPFYECYSTNADDRRVCYGYNYTGRSWLFQHTEKKDWLKDKTVYVSVSGNDLNELCGANESNPCLTVKNALEMCEVQISLTITLIEGNHISEATTIEIGEKKISVIGKGKETCSIGTGALSSLSSAVGTLFSVTTGHLGLLHMKVDCNSNANPSSSSVVVVSDGGGLLSLEDVVITTSVSSGDYVMLSSVFVVALSQLLMTDVEIINMNVSKPLFSEPDLSSSSLSSLSSSALYLTATASGESVLANLTVRM